MTHHEILMIETAEYRRDHYGVTHSSLYVYGTSTSHSPTRIDMWDNTGRPNPFKGMKLGDVAFKGNPHREQVITEWFANKASRPLTAKYFDPQNEPTDAPVSILISPESSAICADTSMNTGQPGSGQVYDKGVTLRREDTATLRFLDGTTRDVALHFTNNGHGYATFTD